MRRIAGDRTVDEGDLVALSSGVLYAGYEGSVGRTWRCSGRPGHTLAAAQHYLYARWRRTFDQVLTACRPGATVPTSSTPTSRRESLSVRYPLAYGVGLGFEGAMSGSALGRDFDATRAIDEGSVLCIQIVVRGDHGVYLASETVQSQTRVRSCSRR